MAAVEPLSLWESICAANFRGLAMGQGRQSRAADEVIRRVAAVAFFNSQYFWSFAGYFGRPVPLAALPFLA